MNQWLEIQSDYFDWLRSFPLLSIIGIPDESPQIFIPTDGPASQNAGFCSKRTHEAEARALRQLSESEIDRIFDDVAAVIDEDLIRFNPLIAYHGQFMPEGDATRINAERETAHCIKRDLAWAAIERATVELGFFSNLIEWYDRGRWPYNWKGSYPSGHVLVL